MPLRNRSLFSSAGNVFFITTTVMNFDRVFALGDVYNDILSNSLKFCLNKYHASLFAYVFMPSHIHLVLGMPAGKDVSAFMRDFKKFTSTKIRKQLENDRYTEWLEHLKHNAVDAKRQMFKLWMDRFDDVVIFTEEMLRTKINYIHENPVRAGLVEQTVDWKYSSARDYLLGEGDVVPVRTDWGIDNV